MNCPVCGIRVVVVEGVIADHAAAGVWDAPECPAGGNVAGERMCKGCGCTDRRLCDGGCWWVAPDLCSMCADELLS